MTTPVKKLTIKTCGDFTPAAIRALLLAHGPWLEEGEGDKKTRKQIMPPDGTAVEIIKISGEANGAQTGQTDKGQYTKLSGNFLGQDITTGELFSSKQCILPEYIGSQLGDALLSAGEGGSSVRFAFQITAKQKASAITGYEFGIKSLMDSAPTDAQAELMKLAGMTAPILKLDAPQVDPAAQAAALAAADAAAAEAKAKAAAAEAEAKADAAAKAKPVKK